MEKNFQKTVLKNIHLICLKKKIETEAPDQLNRFVVSATDRRYNFWQRDPLAIKIFSREVAEQKLEYTHYNPMQEHWNLCRLPEDYRYSSARFYETGVDEFNLLTHYMEMF